MHNKVYERIQELEANVNKKLLNFISEDFNYEEIQATIASIFPNFKVYRNNFTFNLWYATDFLDVSGKSYIDKFLERENTDISDLEKDFLMEKNKSNISLFEVTKIDGEYIEVLNLLENQHISLYEPELSQVVNITDLIFSRIGIILGLNSFIGEVNYLPNNTKEIFLQEVFFDFNTIRKTKVDLTMKEYLKIHSINLYSIYTDCMFESMEMDEDITYNLYEELEEFEAYLSYKRDTQYIKILMNNLIDFFEYYLIEENLSLYDIDKIELKPFFIGAIEDGFITSFEDLNSYIYTFKKYLHFLSKKDSYYLDKYKEILSISENRFQLLMEFQSIERPFSIDGKLANVILENISDNGISTIIDFDKFLLFVYDRPLELTKLKNRIKKVDLERLAYILENTQDIEIKSHSKRNTIILNFFFDFALDMKLLSIKENMLHLEDLGTRFMKLKDNEKYSLFLSYLFKSISLEELKSIEDKDSKNFYLLELFDLYTYKHKTDAISLSYLGNRLVKFLENIKQNNKTVIELSLYHNK